MKVNQKVTINYTACETQAQTTGEVLSLSESLDPLAAIRFELHEPGLHNTFIACFFYDKEEHKWKSSFSFTQTQPTIHVTGLWIESNFLSQNSGTSSLVAAE
jgi:hypothetical protein